MRTVTLAALAVVVGACGSTPDPYEPGVRVETALVDGAIQPPVFRWDAPVAARVTVRRGSTVVWEVADGDVSGPGGTRRGPLTPPLVYGRAPAASGAAAPRVIVPPADLLPGRVYSVTVVGYDGAVFEGRFSVQEAVRAGTSASVEVRQPDGGAPEIVWPDVPAVRVEIHHLASDRLIWAASAGRTRDPMAGVLRSPLPVARFGLPPAVFPPDGRGPEASPPERIEQGERYRVTVRLCQPRSAGSVTICTPHETASAEFTARRTVEPPPLR